MRLQSCFNLIGGGGGHQDGDRVSMHLVQASTPIALPEVNSEGLIVIPDGPRRACESAIEHAANVVAVLNRTSRRIASTALAAAISADTPEEQIQLDAVRGMVHRNNLALAFATPLKPSIALFESLSDRMDGVALMAEAFAHNTSSGKMREFVRLFECAFQRQFSTLGKKLAQTLHSRFGYTREEIQEWIGKRDPLTHADSKKTKAVLFDTDVRAIIHRVEQAALDVLFNKNDWRTWSSSRREKRTPEAWASGRELGGVMLPGTSVTTAFTLSDPFNAYPIGSTSVVAQPGWLLCGYSRKRAIEDVTALDPLESPTP